MKKILLLIGLVLLVGSSKAQAVSIINGGFEEGLNSQDAIISLWTGDTSLTGWTINGSIEAITNYWAPYEGTYSLDLSGITAGEISQNITDLVPNRTYNVSFYLAGNPSGDVKTVRVSAAGKSEDFTFNTAGYSRYNMGWEEKVFSFTANDSSANLTFTSLNHSAQGPALDMVSISDATPVPEPSSAVLGLLSLGGFLGIRRKHR